MLASFPPALAAPSLIVATAVGYAVMTIGIALAVIGFGVAFLAEIVLMRRIDLSIVYVLIVAAETILVLAYAAWIGEGFALRQAFGAAMVFAGLIAVTT